MGDHDIRKAAVEVENLSLSFDGKTLLHRFSFHVREGEHLVLSGPSGSGKSSLLRCLLGFLVPPEGRIRVIGRELNSSTVWALRSLSGYVQQEPALGEGRVKEVLEKPFRYQANRHLSFSLRERDRWMERFRLSQRLLTKNTRALSGGEKQRVALISALLLRRPLYLLDEITSALDEENREAVLEGISGLKATVLAVAHDRAFQRFADRQVEVPVPREISQ